MKRTKKEQKLLHLSKVEKWQHKFMQFLVWLDEPESVPGSHAQILQRIRRAENLLKPHECKERYMKRAIYVSVLYRHLASWLDKLKADLQYYVKANALVGSTLKDCIALAHRWIDYKQDVMMLHTSVEKAEAAFPELF